MLYYSLLFILFLGALLTALNLSMLALGDVFGVIVWIIGIGCTLACIFDDGSHSNDEEPL